MFKCTINEFNETAVYRFTVPSDLTPFCCILLLVVRATDDQCLAFFDDTVIAAD